MDDITLIFLSKFTVIGVMCEIDSKMARMALFENFLDGVSQNLTIYSLQLGNIQFVEMIA